MTTREQEMMELVVDGLQKKQAVGKLGIREITLQIHHGKVERFRQCDKGPELFSFRKVFANHG
ncbi:LuxR C-terminal-related transcriptional regulator [Acidicapsa ligni]|uniref:LuxR C-terminal-related transcriptional regulator n=1 Tax=Acidicapsa ligni TaxID=542300 RepID=UPI0037BFB88B